LSLIKRKQNYQRTDRFFFGESVFGKTDNYNIPAKKNWIM